MTLEDGGDKLLCPCQKRWLWRGCQFVPLVCLCRIEQGGPIMHGCGICLMYKWSRAVFAQACHSACAIVHSVEPFFAAKCAPAHIALVQAHSAARSHTPSRLDLLQSAAQRVDHCIASEVRGHASKSFESTAEGTGPAKKLGYSDSAQTFRWCICSQIRSGDAMQVHVAAVCEWK